VDARSGAVTHASDWGINGERRLPGRALTVLMDDLEEEVRIITSRAAGITLFETFDPRNLVTLEQAEVLDAETGSEPQTYGGCLPLTPMEMEKFGYVNRVGSSVEPVTVLFVPPGSRMKAVMSAGTYGLGRRLILLNSSPENPEGAGYPVPAERTLAQTTFKIARDMTLLNRKRISRLNRHGVQNRRLKAFHARAEAQLDSANIARQQLDHETFMNASRKSWSYASAAYRDIGRTQSDVIQGALFLLAALVPFAHFMERLVLGYSDLRRQVIGYFAFFAAGFLALRYLHPAFELSISPAVILLGFIILSLGTLVTALGISRLNRELRRLAEGHRARGRGSLHRGGAVLTSISVGLAHLRRRPMRTGLTVTTLILLTFSVLSFTSIRASLRTNMVEVEGEASYDGVLIRLPGWKTMEQTAYQSLSSRLGAGKTAPRAWLAVSSLASSFRLERADAPELSTGILGMSGLSAQESRITSPQEHLVSGRWLRHGEDDACVLPIGIAESLHIDPDLLHGTSVRIFGEQFRVVGILQPDALNRLDLNGEPITPLDPEAQQPSEVRSNRLEGGQLAFFTHLPAENVIVLPYNAVIRWERARLVSLAIQLDNPEQELADLAQTLDLNLFAGLGGRRFLVNTVGVSSVSGVADLVIPIGIAALIVLNTMLGAVYERTREIGTFNAIGLAPGHVSGLFMAEACACAVVGGVLGYLLGQAVAQSISRWGLLPGLELNFSSLSAVFTLGLVMSVVLLSAIYPSRKAASVCTPGIERRWSPPNPNGDQLEMVLPFTLVESDATGMAAFIAEFWEIHQEQSIGAGFFVESVQVSQSPGYLRLDCKVWLAPFDQGLVQEVMLDMKMDIQDSYYIIRTVLHRDSGDYETWRRVCRTFLDDLRKQFLLWRTLNEEDRAFYIHDLQRWLVADRQPDARPSST
jgi:ABC-type antimicrobial peptide transport system permease subunit